jgi:Flp pilus assembly protein TadD
LDPVHQHATATMGLGMVAQQSGKFEEANHHYKQAHTLEPTNPNVNAQIQVG